MSSESKKKFLCKQCDYPAQSKDEFADKEGFHVQTCPNCGCRETKFQQNFNTSLAWKMLQENGITHKLWKFGVWLWLKEYDKYNPPKNKISYQISEDMIRKLGENWNKAKEILESEDFTKIFKELNILIEIHSTGSES